MKREILISGTQRETRVAILEDDRLVELLVDRPDHKRIIGDIYLGRVEAVLPGIQAAFVDIGLEKSAFLHASDLLEPEDDDSTYVTLVYDWDAVTSEKMLAGKFPPFPVEHFTASLQTLADAVEDDDWDDFDEEDEELGDLSDEG